MIYNLLIYFQGYKGELKAVNSMVLHLIIKKNYYICYMFYKLMFRKILLYKSEKYRESY